MKQDLPINAGILCNIRACTEGRFAGLNEVFISILNQKPYIRMRQTDKPAYLHMLMHFVLKKFL